MDIFKNTLEVLHPQSLKHLSNYLNDLLKKHLWAKVLSGFVIGILLGVIISPELNWIDSSISQELGEWLAFPGQLFLRLVQMIVIPLIFASVIRGVASSDNINQLKQLGLRIGIYFVFTTTVAIVIGIVTVTFVKPGALIDTQLLTQVSSTNQMQVDINRSENNDIEIRTLPRKVIGLLPQNPLTAMTDSNMLQVVLFSLIVGFALIAMTPKQAQPLLDLLGSIQEVCMIVVKWAMFLAPFAVFGLTTQMVSTVGLHALTGMGAYVATVLMGLIFVLLFYLLIILFVGKKNPFHFLKSIVNVQLLAFSTSSSAAVMPLSIKTAEEDLGVRTSISHFVIPLGSTINMDGTALYQIIATIFLAQVYQIDLSLGQMTLIGITALGASIGSPGTPGVGIVILATILQSVGIPLEGTALIIAVDRILDMSRTAVNVTGDLTACIVMDKLIKDDQPT
ncbi:MAG: dicarboxylate/amino acid:cation symporter [Bdellovibrionales bacterium]|nr:dicarboxylate/amino acid:cation symporter [Bdellovibrionales bacterium]